MKKTEINFYQIDEVSAKAFAPLLLKIIDEKKKAFILCKESAEISQFDNELWSYGRNKFIPHVTSFDKEFKFERQPVVIGNEEKNLNNSDYLICFEKPSDAFISSFSRVFYFFNSRNIENAKSVLESLKSVTNQINFYKKEEDKWKKSSSLN